MIAGGFISCCASARLGEPADGYSEESAADHADEMNPMSSDDPHGSFQDEYEEEMDAPYSEDEKVLDAEGMPMLSLRVRSRQLQRGDMCQREKRRTSG